ncbi:hypothetical protein HanIR_Chr11g0557561 [Helianthus annuus]|nr:hypothetical protein HanIR_Chr11g0557561 [Helianthus annuus]
MNFIFTDNAICLDDKALLKKAKGCPSCRSTAPIPLEEASVSTTNILLRSGKANTGASHNAAFNCSKDC